MTLTIPGTQPTATKQGWHLVTFQNGATAVVRWNGRNWVWGSLPAPPSPVIGVTYLGSNIQDVVAHGTRFSNAIAGLPSKVSTELISALDHGALGLKGQPVLFDSKGDPVGPQSKWTGSEAVPVNVIPSPIDPNVGNQGHLSVPNPLDFLSFLGDISFWIRLMEAIVGAVLIFIGLRALTGQGSGSPIDAAVKTVKRVTP